jgi:hypothetical protein
MPETGNCRNNSEKVFKEGNIQTGYKTILVLSEASAHTRLSRAGVSTEEQMISTNVFFEALNFSMALQ